MHYARLVFSFGLPRPHHSLIGGTQEMYQRMGKKAKEKREYIFKEASDGRLINGSLLVDERLGSAIRTFREKEEEKSKFPHISNLAGG